MKKLSDFLFIPRISISDDVLLCTQLNYISSPIIVELLEQAPLSNASFYDFLTINKSILKGLGITVKQKNVRIYLIRFSKQNGRQFSPISIYIMRLIFLLCCGSSRKKLALLKLYVTHAGFREEFHNFILHF